MRIWISLLVPGVALGYSLKRTGDGVPLRWPEGPVGCAIDRVGSDDVPGRAEFGAVRAALAAWNAIPGSPLSLHPLEEDEGDAVARVSWWPDWADQPDALAVTVVTYDVDTGDILDADIRVNDEVDWTIAGGPADGAPRFDVQNTVVHEVGHLLGLAHSEDVEASMFATSPPGEIAKRDLEADDRAGFERLYGPSSGEDVAAADRAAGCSVIPGPGARGSALVVMLLVLFAAALRAPALCALLVAQAAQASPTESVTAAALIARADRVVVARVLHTESLWVHDTIYTDSTVEVLDCLRGPCPARLIVRQPGGEVGRIGQSVEGRVALGADEDVLLLLRRRSDGTVDPVRMALGVLRLEGDRAVWPREASHLDGGATSLAMADARRLCARPKRSKEGVRQPIDDSPHGIRPEQGRGQHR